MMRVLIIHPRLDVAVALKQALERAGAYEVHAFTAVDTAVDYLRYYPQDVALLDLTLPPGGGDVVRLLRTVQRDLALVVSPAQDADALRQLDVQASVSTPWSARQLIPVLESARFSMMGEADDTQRLSLTRAAAPPAPPKTLPGGLPVVPPSAESAPAEQPPQQIVLPPEALAEERGSALFKKLAAEEPPMPTFEDSATVHDLRVNVSEQNYREVISILSSARIDKPGDKRRPAAPPVPPLPDLPTEELPAAPEDIAKIDTTEVIPAQFILETALDETTPLNLALSTIEKQLTQAQIPIAEPDFLAELESSEPLPPAAAAPGEPEPHFIESISPPRPVMPPPTLPEQKKKSGEMPLLEEPEALSYTRPLTPEEIRELAADFEKLAAFDLLPDDVALPEAPPEPEEAPDPEAARLALKLTKAALESTAEAILLAFHHKLVACVGPLPREEVETLGATVANDWKARPNEARVRFATLNGRDYMLYSRQTDGGFTLTMIFAGDLPLTAIRRQGNRMYEALLAAPEAEAEAEPDTTPLALAEMPPEAAVEALPAYSGTLTAYTYLWLVRDPETVLNEAVRRAIIDALPRQLKALYWDIKSLDVHEDYICLVADVPGENPAQFIIRDLKQRTAALAVAQDAELDADTLWLDSYLVITPARELKVEEIQQFMRFARM
ncbi:MAG: response regulator transcription factor [Chloroflexi bacterium]|nr:response regulator transcription factor [Chloroflexota bacterium]